MWNKLVQNQKKLDVDFKDLLFYLHDFHPGYQRNISPLFSVSFNSRGKGLI